MGYEDWPLSWLGFVAFRDRGDAGKALSSMDGEWIGSRAIRCNWVNQKVQSSISQQQAKAKKTVSTQFKTHSNSILPLAVSKPGTAERYGDRS